MYCSLGASSGVCWATVVTLYVRDSPFHRLRTLFRHSQPVHACSRYGMLISVMADNLSDFEGLLRFYNHFSNGTSGLMGWQQLLSADGTVCSNPEPSGSNSAMDGDMDAAYALFQAGVSLSRKQIKEPR